MRFLKAVPLFIVLATMLVPCAGLAQFGDDDETQARDSAEWTGRSERRRPSVLHRPARDSALTQLDYANRLLEEGKTRKALRAYRALVHTWHDTPQAVEAQATLARVLMEEGHYREAFNEFQYLVDNHAGLFEYDHVLDQQFRIAHHMMTTRRGKFLLFPGFDSPGKALEMFNAIIRNAPTWEKTPQAIFYTGAIHEKARDYQLAIQAYETLRTRYPESYYAEKAAFQRALNLYTLSTRRPRDERSCRLALSALAGYERDYPLSTDSARARNLRDDLNAKLAGMYYERATYYDRIAGRPDAAIIAYNDFERQFPLTDMAETARERLAVLERRQEKARER